MNIAEIFFHFRFSILRETWVPSPQSNKNSSPSRRRRTDVRNLPGRGIIPLVPNENASRFTCLSYLSYSPFTRVLISFDFIEKSEINTVIAETNSITTMIAAIDFKGIDTENDVI